MTETTEALMASNDSTETAEVVAADAPEKTNEAFATISKKLSQAQAEAKAAKEEAENLRKIKEDADAAIARYNEAQEELNSLRAEQNKAHLTQSLQGVVDHYGWDEAFFNEIIKNHTEEELLAHAKDAKSLRKFLVAEHLDEIEAYDPGKRNQKPEGSQMLNLNATSGGTASEEIDYVAMGKQWAKENSQQRLFGFNPKKGNK